MVDSKDFGTEAFHKAAYAAGHEAFEETLAAGRPVFYVDAEGLNVVEYPDGRRYEIRWGSGPEFSYEIVRQLKARAA